MRAAAGQEIERVRDGGQHHLDGLDRAARGAGHVADQRLAPHTRHRARQHAEAAAVLVADAPNRFDEAGGIAFDHRACALRRQVARTEPGAARRDDPPGEPVGQLAQRGGHAVDAVGDHAAVDDGETGVGEAAYERVTALVVARTGDDTVRDGEDFRL